MMTNEIWKMEYLEEYLEFLDDLRDSGAVNMAGAARHLRDEFDELSKSEARQVASYWRQTYNDRHPEGE